MTTWVLSRPALHTAVPTMTEAMVLARLGHRVRVITSTCHSETRAFLMSQGIDLVQETGPTSTGSMVARAASVLHFRRQAWSLLRARSDTDLLWVASGETAIALGPRLQHGQCNYILKLRELHDTGRHYERALWPHVRCASAVVVPEPCRAAIVRTLYSLPRTPVVVLNRPWHHPRARGLAAPPLDCLDTARQSPRMVLYMGVVAPDRGLTAVAQAVAECGEPWVFAVMGRDLGALDALRRATPSIVCIPYEPPPAHLAVASHAYIGIAKYDHTSLNNVFCAPNKIWEYAGFGIPCLGSHMPSLRLAFAETGMGICVDLDCVESIKAGLQLLDSRYDFYSRNADAAFEAADPAIGIARAVNVAVGQTRPSPGSRMQTDSAETEPIA